MAFKMKGQPFKRNFGIGTSESPDATSPLNQDLTTGISKLRNFFSAMGDQIGINDETLGGGAGGDVKDVPARQRGWGQVLAKSLAAGMRTLPGGYDAYNPPGQNVDMKNILGNIDLSKIKDLKIPGLDNIDLDNLNIEDITKIFKDLDLNTINDILKKKDKEQ